MLHPCASGDTYAAFTLGIEVRTLRDMVEASKEAQIAPPFFLAGSQRRWHRDFDVLFRWAQEVGEWRASARSRTAGKSDGGGREAGTGRSTPTPSAPTPKLVATNAAPKQPSKKAATIGPLESFRRGLSK